MSDVEPDAPPPFELSDELRARLEKIVKADQVVLFMKGVRQSPQCGFSASVVEILDDYAGQYSCVDVLIDPEMREAVKAFSDWPTIPQLYVKGEFVGGADIVQAMHDSGDLEKLFGGRRDRPALPTITMSDDAADQFSAALDDADEGESLRLAIDYRYYNDLSIGPPEEGDVEVDCSGIKLRLDPRSAARAHKMHIDFVEGPEGSGFRLDNPNAPPPVQDIFPKDLAARMNAEPELRVYDVRTPEEMQRASIEGTRPFDNTALIELESLPRDTPLVFHCHHGGRSATAAAHLVGMGFTQVFNLIGGIEAWSKDVDPSVPRY